MDTITPYFLTATGDQSSATTNIMINNAVTVGKYAKYSTVSYGLVIGSNVFIYVVADGTCPCNTHYSEYIWTY